MIVHELFIQHSENISIPNEVHYTRQETINVTLSAKSSLILGGRIRLLFAERVTNVDSSKT